MDKWHDLGDLEVKQLGSYGVISKTYFKGEVLEQITFDLRQLDYLIAQLHGLKTAVDEGLTGVEQ